MLKPFREGNLNKLDNKHSVLFRLKSSNIFDQLLTDKKLHSDASNFIPNLEEN